MARADVYIRRHNEERWAKIEDKSGWVNAKLEQEDHPLLIMEPGKPLGMVSRGGETCKNGHAIPDGRSKCMGKGCKYS